MATMLSQSMVRMALRLSRPQASAFSSSSSLSRDMGSNVIIPRSCSADTDRSCRHSCLSCFHCSMQTRVWVRTISSSAALSAATAGWDTVEITKTDPMSSTERTPVANAGGADANRPSISTEDGTCSHGISTNPNLLKEEEDDEMEDMFVEPDVCLGTDAIEWGGPRRGGQLAEPTRFGDWERKGRCTDF